MTSEHQHDELPVCDVTGETVDECDHAFPYDEDDEADDRYQQQLDERD